VVLLVLVLPLPWRATAASVGPGTSWRLDGRLVVDGAPLDPPGEVRWLAAGRPPTLAERLLEATGRGAPTTILTRGDVAATPDVAVPTAVAAARTAVGSTSPDAAVPDARIALRLGPVDAGRLARNLRLGDSNGLAVALLVLRADGAVGAGGGTVAATGRVDRDGTVRPVGGIAPKVRAAARAGAVTVLVPSGQEEEARAAAGPSGPAIVGVAHVRDLLGPQVSSAVSPGG
jgi:hypothetical protein